MTLDELIDAMSGFFETFGASLSATQWTQYWEALQDVNPGDIDDAMRELRRTHQYHNAPLPYEILTAANKARRARLLSVRDAEPVADPGECVRMKHYFAPFDYALELLVFKKDPKPYHCTRCDDAGFVQLQRQGPIWLYGKDAPMLNYTERCHCGATNPVIQKRREQNATHAITTTKSRSKE